MTRAIQGKHPITFCASLLIAMTSLSSPSFAQSGLFPAPSQTTNQAPAALPPLGSAPAQQAPMNDAPVIQDPGGEPLRVLIPNIHQEPKKARGKGTGNGSSAHATASANAGNQNDSYGSFSSLMQEAWFNGVMLAQRGGKFITRNLFKPEVPFAPVPEQWALVPTAETHASVATIASLSPAAGGENAIAPSGPAAPPETPIVQIAPQEQPTPVPPAPVAIVSSSQAPAEKIIPAPAAMVDTSEPAPVLSSKSKAIVAKIAPPPENPSEKPFTRSVNIERTRDTASAITTAQPEPGKIPGIQTSDKTSNYSSSYELERAYNALVAGNTQAAIEIYQDILSNRPKNKEALFGLATTYHRAGQLDMARMLYGKLLEQDPKHRDGLNNFLVLLAEEAPQEALVQMEQLETQNPDFSPIPAQMAIIYGKLGNREKAIDKMYRALAISPENITYRYNLAILLDKDGRYEQAAKLYAQLLDAHLKGAVIPGNATKLQQRLTFIRSNMK